MKVNQRLLRNLALNIAFGLYLLHLLHGGVIGVDVGAVMLIVVEFHDLARNRRFEGAVVIYIGSQWSAMTEGPN